VKIIGFIYWNLLEFLLKIFFPSFDNIYFCYDLFFTAKMTCAVTKLGFRKSIKNLHAKWLNNAYRVIIAHAIDIQSLRYRSKIFTKIYSLAPL